MGRSSALDKAVNSVTSSANAVPQETVEPTLTKDRSNLIPSGCGILDIASSQTQFGAWHIGTMVNLVGDKSAGKSILALSGLAQCCAEKRFDDFRIIYDDTESAGNVQNMGHLFGKELARRVEAPPIVEEGLLGSTTSEQFQANFFHVLDDGRPFIYVTDSLDGMSSTAEMARVEAKSAVTAGTATAKQKKLAEGGTYGTERARNIGETLRTLYPKLLRSRGLLIVTSQVRENLDAMPFTPKYRRNGGKALDHYCQHILWIMKGGAKAYLKRTVRGKSHKIGHHVVAKFEKNRLTGWEGQVEWDVYRSYGVDSVASMVDWLVEEKYWKGGGAAQIDATDLGLKLMRAALLVAVTEDKLETKLARVALKAWLELQQELALDRPGRF